VGRALEPGSLSRSGAMICGDEYMLEPYRQCWESCLPKDFWTTFASDAVLRAVERQLRPRRNGERWRLLGDSREG